MDYFRVSTINHGATLWLKRYAFDTKTGEIITDWTPDETQACFFFLDEINKMELSKSIDGSTLLLWKRKNDGTDEAPIYLSIVLS